MTLTYKLDLGILPLDLHAKTQIRTSVRSAVRVVKDRHTHRQTDDAKTITTDTSEMWSINIWPMCFTIPAKNQPITN